VPKAMGARRVNRRPAVRAYERAIVLRHAAAATCLNQRGACLARMDELAMAVESYSEALELSPQMGIIWHNRGSALMQMGKLAEAAADLERALELQPLPESEALLGDVRMEMSQTEEGKAAYMAGMEFFAGNEFESALQEFRRALGEGVGATRRARCMNAVGLCHSAAGQLEQALRAFSQAVETDPTNGRAWHNRSKTHAARGDGAAVSRPFPSWNRSMLTEICLCHACSCPGILRTETGGQADADAQMALKLHSNGGEGEV
jgi:Tfp pilus assembly protein PilF